MSVIRLACGVALGMALGAVFGRLVHPLVFMSDEVIREWGALLSGLLALVGSFLAGYLSASLAGRHGVLVAIPSVWLGSSLGSSLGHLDPLDFIPGLYPFFALGGALIQARRPQA